MRLKMSGNGRLPKFVVHNVKPKSQFPNDGKIQKIATLVPAIVQFVSDDRNFQWYFGKTPKPHAGSPKNLALTMSILDLEEALQLDILQRLPLWPNLTPRHGVSGVCAAWRRLVAVCVCLS